MPRPRQFHKPASRSPGVVKSCIRSRLTKSRSALAPELRGMAKTSKRSPAACTLPICAKGLHCSIPAKSDRTLSFKSHHGVLSAAPQRPDGTGARKQGIKGRRYNRAERCEMFRVRRHSGGIRGR